MMCRAIVVFIFVLIVGVLILGVVFSLMAESQQICTYEPQRCMGDDYSFENNWMVYAAIGLCVVFGALMVGTWSEFD